MAEAAIITLPGGKDHIALAGIRINRLLSAGLFREAAGLSGMFAISEACHDRWTDLAATIVALPDPIEALMLIGHDVLERGSGETTLAFLAVGRAKDQDSAQSRCSQAFQDLWMLLITTLDYAELQPIENEETLERLVKCLSSDHVHEIRRRLEGIPISHGVLAPGGETVGFVKIAKKPAEGESRKVAIDHLFPWVPSHDSWRRILEILTAQYGGAFLLAHIRGYGRAPKAAEEHVLRTMAMTERIVQGWLEPGMEGKTVLADTAMALRQEELSRLAILKGGVLAARLFLATGDKASAGLIATVLQSIDDASVRRDQPNAGSLFRGGAGTEQVDAHQILAPLDRPTLDLLFGPREATAFLRTPMPSDSDMPGLPMNRARTAPLVGKSGEDCMLGVNIHRAAHVPVSLDEPDRFRHTYIVGQTGTGKSTLLLHMILQDIAEGRGVAVLDPHGTLIEDIIARFPRSRIDDAILIDVGDIERPIGLNILRIDEKEPLRYRAARDFLIDDLYGLIDRTYDLKQTGGPIFESHFRNMLALLLGFQAPTSPLIPSLMVFRALYTNSALLRRLCKRMGGRDPVIDEFIREAEAIDPRQEASLRNLAPYITSKFGRFISDTSLRNITCQREMLDLDRVVNESKVLLFYTGRGRFGDYAAGLLAGQILSRIRHIVMKRGAQGIKKPFYLYADEFQLFADARFGELLAEARKFGMSLTLAHQYARQLPDSILQAVLGNVGTTIAFRVGSTDAERLEPLFAPQFNRRDLTALPNYRAYIRSSGPLGEVPFSLETPAPPNRIDPSIAFGIRRQSRELYGRERTVVEAEIRETYSAYMELRDKESGN